MNEQSTVPQLDALTKVMREAALRLRTAREELKQAKQAMAEATTNWQEAVKRVAKETGDEAGSD